MVVALAGFGLSVLVLLGVAMGVVMGAELVLINVGLVLTKWGETGCWLVLYNSTNKKQKNQTATDK